MSIETFFEYHPANDKLIGYLSEQDEFKKGHSNARALADFVYREGHNGLIELTKMVRSRSRTRLPNVDLTPPLLFPDESLKLRRNKAAILWGAMFLTIEDIIVDGIYRPSTLLDKYSQGLEGTTWATRLDIDDPSPLIIGPRQVEQIKNLAMHVDRSLARFMTESGLSLLPQSLQDTIKRSGIWVDLSEIFYYRYRPIADVVCPTPVPEPEHEQTSTIFVPSPSVRYNPLRIRGT